MAEKRRRNGTSGRTGARVPRGVSHPMLLARAGLVAGLWAAAAAAQGPLPLALHGDIQADGRFVWGETDASTFVVRRARLRAEGVIDGRFRFRAMPDVGNGRVELLDAYVEAAVVPGVAVRAGKFKAPVGLERLRTPTDLDLPERAFPTLLVPNRDVGVMLRLTPGRQTVELAVTNGVVDGASGDLDPDAAKDLNARLFLRPVRSGVLRGLAVGVAGTVGAARGTAGAPLLPTVQTSGREIVFRYRAGTDPAVADGAHQRVVPQLFWTAGPVGVLAEAAASCQRVRLGDAAARLTNRAWQVAATVVLTGEDASFGAVVPRRPLTPDGGGPGAVALAARLHRLAVDANAFPTFADPTASVRVATAGALGLNWSLTSAVRVQLSAERTVFEAAEGGADRAAETLVVGRVQLVY